MNSVPPLQWRQFSHNWNKTFQTELCTRVTQTRSLSNKQEMLAKTFPRDLGVEVRAFSAGYFTSLEHRSVIESRGKSFYRLSWAKLSDRPSINFSTIEINVCRTADLDLIDSLRRQTTSISNFRFSLISISISSWLKFFNF